VKAARTAAVIGILAALVWPEIPRYAAERRVGYATTAFLSLLDRSGDPETARNIAAVGELALLTTGSLPDDPRPWVLAGSSCLVTGRPERALELYREAFATGERSEIDLNLGRAYALLNRADSAAAAHLRAGWVSPEILESLPPAVKDPLLAEIARLSEQLRHGKLTEPPPLPEQERREQKRGQFRVPSLEFRVGGAPVKLVTRNPKLGTHCFTSRKIRLE
jgi:tetratricopeptide (TPR) repeat protein